MQVEWAKSKAHADLWEEAYFLAVEEMQCTIVFLDWEANWWTERACLRPTASVAVCSGLCAYAHKQAAIYRGLALSFAHQWYLLMLENSIPIEWLAAYIPQTLSQ